MRMRFRFAVVIASLIIVTPFATQSSTPPAGSQKRAITEKDLFDFIWVANPQLSPDGTHVAFTRVNVDEKRTGYETSIWTVATSGSEPPVRMTNGKHDAQPQWSPNGKRIAFVRGGDKDETGKPKPAQIAMLSLAGGEAWIITDLPKGAADPVWSPDSSRIAFVSSTTPEDIEKAQHKKTSTKGSETKEAAGATNTTLAKQPESEHESDVRVISRAVYRSNDAGYLDPKRHRHIWVLDVPTTSDELTKPVQLTSGDFDEREPIWSHDNSRLYHTPVLFVLGESDYRTPQDSGGEQLFRALKFLKRPTAMVVFPRETHELSRSGEPWHRIERLNYIVGWFDKWIMGVPHPEYDVRPDKPVAKPGP
jgi:dipeptidyl aminopeptidase/acylaminoacyl peptidase